MEVERYLELITSQYQNSPKFKAWVDRLLTPYVDCQNLALNLWTHFDIETAVGKQLDMLGEVIGVRRLLPFTPTEDDPLLGDEDYRFLLKAQILKNIWDGTNDSIYNVWEMLNPEVAISIKDNQDMTVEILFIGAVNQLQQEMIQYGLIVPKAQGVAMYYVFSLPPLFAYNQDTEYFKGYDEGNWAELNL